MTQRWWILLFCGIVTYLTLFYQLGNLAFFGSDEPRYARISEEMVLRGNYVTPTLNFRPWLEKPPLLFWLQAASFRVFGIQEWSARFPVALLGAFSTLVTGFFCFKLVGWRAAILAALTLCTSGLFFVFARAASPDLPLAAMLSVAMISAFLATSRKTALWGAIAGGALALAVLAKGPIAVVLFASILISYCLLVQKYPWNWRQTLFAAVAFVGVALPWFWKVWLENGYNFVATFWLNHHLARLITAIHHHSQPFWYYLPVILVGFFPWVVFLPSAFMRFWRKRARLTEAENHAELFLWLWVAIPLLFFSFSEGKLAGYVLPVFPALAAIVALEWDRCLERDAMACPAMRWEVIVLIGCGFLFSLTLLLDFHFIYQSLALGGLLSVPILAGVLWAGYEYRKQRLLPAFLALVAGMALFAALAFWQAAPVVDDFHSARDLCRYSLSLISKENPLILYRYFHHTAQYYTGYRTTPEALPNVWSLKAYMRTHPRRRYYLLTQDPGLMDILTWLKTRSSLVRVQGNLYLAEIVRSEF